MKNKAIGILILVLVSLFTACNNTEDKSISEPAIQQSENDLIQISNIQFQSSEMDLGKMQKVDFHTVVKANGIIDVPPENRAAVSSYFSGTVKEIKLLPGEFVKKGQVLFTLENPDYVQIQQDYLEAKGQLNYLESDYQRQKNLAEDNITSQKNFLKAESDYTVTKVRFESLAKKLALMNIDPDQLSLERIQTTIRILSPISGFITHVDIARGAFLDSSQQAVTIVSTDHLHAELTVFEKDIQRIKVGQSVLFRTQDNNGGVYRAEVYLVNRVVDPEKRSASIHCHLVNEKQVQGLNPGMYIEAEIFTDSELKSALPSDAIVDIEGKHFVLELQSKSDSGFTFIQKEVITGLVGKTDTEIRNADTFEENAEFLLKGSFNLIHD